MIIGNIEIKTDTIQDKVGLLILSIFILIIIYLIVWPIYVTVSNAMTKYSATKTLTSENMQIAENYLMTLYPDLKITERDSYINAIEKNRGCKKLGNGNYDCSDEKLEIYDRSNYESIYKFTGTMNIPNHKKAKVAIKISPNLKGGSYLYAHNEDWNIDILELSNEGKTKNIWNYNFEFHKYRID